MTMQKCLLSGLLAVLVCSVTAVYADCQSDYETARNKLDKVKRAALGQTEKDPNFNSDTFTQELKVSVDNLQRQNCAAEMMQLLQYIQLEQKSYPAP